MEKQGLYIYGILNSNANLNLSIPKSLLLDPSLGPSLNEGKAYPLGLEESESNGVYTIAYQDISALVRDSEIVDYTHMRKDILARFLIGHQRVIERVMTTQTTIIPMRLGTHVLDETEVKEILNKGYNLIKQIFEKIKDRIEIDVAATFSDFDSVLKEIAQEREINEFKEGLLVNPKGVTVDDQMKVGFMVKKALDEKRQKYANSIQNALKTFSHDFKAHELMDDKMIADIAFLIDKADQKEFQAKIEHLNDEFSEKLNFRCVGPLPSYSFYTLEVKKMKFDDIDWARKKLGLNENASREEIKKAHQTKAFIYHPDKNPNVLGIEREFDEVTKAYNILQEYCQQERSSFGAEEFKKNAILIKLKG